ncbi:MAG: sulfur carrier protein ThiS [Bacteroidota bacterium]
MEIIVNDSKKNVNDGTTLFHVVEHVVGEKQKGIAVAVNETVIPKQQWNNHLLQPHDTILIIKATQGG